MIIAQKIARFGSWEDNIQDGTQYWSDEIYDFFGILPNEVEASTENFLKYIHTDDRELLMDEYKSAIAEKREFNATYRIVSKDKKLIYVEAKAKIFFDVHGNPLKSIGTVYDVTQRVLNEKKLKENEFKLQFTIEGNGDGYWDWDTQTNEIYFSPRWKEMLGYRDDEIENDFDEWKRRIHPEDIDRILLSAQEHIDGKTQKHVNEHRLRCKDGSYKWILARGIALSRDENGKAIKIMGTHTDITTRKENEENLKLAASVFLHAKEAIVITDKNNDIIEVNEAFIHITGYEKREVIGLNPKILKSGRHDREFYKDMWDNLLKEDFWHGEIWNRRKNGEVYPELLTISVVKDEKNDIKNYVALFSDISSQKRYQQRLEFLAHNDPLTKLPNRVLFSDRLNQAIIKSKRTNEKIAIVYLDLDGFKEINDQYSHDMGDKLLVKLSNKMKNILRESDTIARFGGDEFVIVLSELTDAKDSIKTISRLLEVVSQPLRLEGIDLCISASAGVTFYPQEIDIDADHLIRQADQAMYQAKVLGKKRYHIFDAAEDKNVKTHYEEIEKIKAALLNEEFVLYYQPKIDIQSNRICGFEALIRWNHPEKGLLLPYAFLPIMENQEVSIDVGEWVIKTALQRVRELKKIGIETTISVNVSAYQLQDIQFPDKLQKIVDAFSDVAPSSLELEILETSILENLEDAADVVRACKNVGVKMALDDFGTGYSSLAYLRKLDIDTVKIDKGFVIDMLNSKEDAAIVEGIILLSNSFNHDVIAEGVETKEHLELLKKLDCKMAQGYFIAKPMPYEDLTHWIEHWDASI